MIRYARVLPLLLTWLLLDAARGDQPTGNLVFCKRRRGDAGAFVSDGEGKNPRKVMFLCGPEICPRFSPDGKSILFSCVEGGKASVWTANQAGEDRKRICEGDQATWSPDGSKILFRRAGQIMERTLKSGEEKMISPPGWKSCAFPDCSPDGKNMFFVAEADGRLKLFMMTPGTADQKAVADLGIVSPARWSPDGRRIAYSDGAHIFVMGADRSWTYQLTLSGGVQCCPAWSPDGTKVVYCHAPTVQGGWILGVTNADGTKTCVLPKEDDVVSFFTPDWRAAEAKPAESAANLRPSPQVSVWDIGKFLSPAPAEYSELVKKREGWQRVSGAQALKGGVVLENDGALFLFCSKACSALLIPKPVEKQTPVVELIPVSEKGEEARNVESLKLTRNDGEEAVVELSSSTAGGPPVRTSWRVRGSWPFVQVSPIGNAGCVRVRAPMKFAVVPDRFADDVVYESASYAGVRLALPAAAVALGFIGSGDAILELACPSDAQAIDLLKDAGQGKLFSGAEVRFAGKAFAVGVLTGQRLWYEERPNAKYERKRMDLKWEMPNPGAWRLVVRVDGRGYSRMFEEKGSEWFDGKKLSLTEKEEFSGALDLALVYLYGRSLGTPLDRLTPADLALDGMGFESFVRRLDIEGIESYRTAPQPTDWADILDTLKSIRYVYDQGLEKEERTFVEHLCDDVPTFLEGMDGRLDEFAAFTRNVAELSKTSGRATPQAKKFFEGIDPLVKRLEELCSKRAALKSRAEAIGYLKAVKELTPKDDQEKKKKFSELWEKLSQAANERGDGSGYPGGLTFKDLTMADHILIVADMFDAMNSDRAYRAHMRPGEIMELLESEKGPRLQSDVVNALQRLHRQGRLPARR